MASEWLGIPRPFFRLGLDSSLPGSQAPQQPWYLVVLPGNGDLSSGKFQQAAFFLRSNGSEDCSLAGHGLWGEVGTLVMSGATRSGSQC